MASAISWGWAQFTAPDHCDRCPIDPSNPLFGTCGCGCGCSSCGKPPPAPGAPKASGHPVRYGTGEAVAAARLLAARAGSAVLLKLDRDGMVLARPGRPACVYP